MAAMMNDAAIERAMDVMQSGLLAAAKEEERKLDAQMEKFENLGNN